MVRLLLSSRLGDLRLTQADLARMTGIRPNTINLMYHEMCDQIKFEHIDRICDALKCDMDEWIIWLPSQSRMTSKRI